MDPPSPILLPYGLSKEHQSFLAGNKPIIKNRGPLSFRIASLDELRTSYRLYAQSPPLAPPVTTSAPNKQSRIVRPDESDTWSQRNTLGIHMAPEVGKKKRDRSRKRFKPSVSVSKTLDSDAVSRHETKNALNIGVNLRLGTSHGMPITIDSDSASETSGNSDIILRDILGKNTSPARPVASVPDLDHTRYQHRSLSVGPRRRRKDVTPLRDKHASSGFTSRSSPPAYALCSPSQSSPSESETIFFHKSTLGRREPPCTQPDATIRNKPKRNCDILKHQHVTDTSEFTSLAHNTRPTNMRDARSSGAFSRIKSKSPGPWQYRSLQTKSESRKEFPNTPTKLGIPSPQPPGKSREVTSDNERDMTLIDIEDFSLRKKVAKLMAVAPALPIRDLYYLVIDSEGRVSKAKKKAICMIGAPHAPIHDDHSEDVMAKIDPNDPAFQWDDDETISEPTSTLKAHPLNSNIRNKTLNHDHSRPSLKLPKDKKTAKAYPHQSMKRSKISHPKRTSARETSSDREFIVPDRVIEYAWDLGDYDESNDLRYNARKKVATPRRKYSLT